jgi:uncharacterized protein YqgV (UPF0045/DUF77 family)
MIHEYPLDQLREAAKAVVQRHFVGIAESDGTQPTLRAMYVLKLQEARGVLAGTPSDLVSGEAQIRGITPEQMAQVIVAMAEQNAQLELARMQTNVRIDTAEDEAGIVAVLDEFGLEVSLLA